MPSDDWKQRLLEAIRSGTPIDLSSDASSDPAEGATWGPERIVSADAIRAALFARELSPDPRGLGLVGARITGVLDLEDSTVPCPVQFWACSFDSVPVLDDARCGSLLFDGSHLPGLGLIATRVTSGLYLNRITCNGLVNARGASIGGRLRARGSRLQPTDGPALVLDGAEIGDGATFDDGFLSTGEIRLNGAVVRGQLVMGGATLDCLHGDALNLDGAEITLGVYLDGGFRCSGRVRANGARMKTGLVLGGARFDAGGELSLVQAEIGSGVFSEGGLAGDAVVNAAGATIDGPVILDGSFGAFHAPFARLGLVRLGEGVVDVDLSNASVRTLGTAGDADHLRRGAISAHGLRLTDLDGRIREDRTLVAAWLDTDPGSFAVEPWHEFAAVYERNGRVADGKWLRMQAAHRVTRDAAWYAKLVRWPYLLFAGYGYYPLLAAIWLVGAAVLAGLLAHLNPDVFSSADANTLAAGFNPWLYGASVVIPPAAAVTPQTWAITVPWLAWSLAALKTFGWLQTALLLAGVTGLLRRS